MLLLDTQIWIWWSTSSPDLTLAQRRAIERAEPDGLAMSAFTAWEAAMLEVHGRVDVGAPVRDWLDAIRQILTLHLVPLVPEILVDAVQLPPPFHADPADRIIVATARHLKCPILTSDQRIIDYPNVQVI